MNLDELLASGWERHATLPAEVSLELEENCALVHDARAAASFLVLSNHTMGDHLGDWPRAQALALRLAPMVPLANESPSVLMSLALAQAMNGRWVTTQTHIADIVRLGDEDAAAVLAKFQVQLARSLASANDLDSSSMLYHSALALGRLEKGRASERSIAITSNNLATDLLDRAQRTYEQDVLMHEAADAAYEFWSRCGTWVNVERALYLLALVHNALGACALAREKAEEALALIAANGEEKVDEAFLRLALADALRQAQERGRYEEELRRADDLAAAFADDGLKGWFQDARSKMIRASA